MGSSVNLVSIYMPACQALSLMLGSQISEFSRTYSLLEEIDKDYFSNVRCLERCRCHASTEQVLSAHPGCSGTPGECEGMSGGDWRIPNCRCVLGGTGLGEVELI